MNSDMSFDADLLQQPLLSSQIIPELVDEEPAIKLIKTENVQQPVVHVYPITNSNVKAKLSVDGKRIETVRLNNGNVGVLDNGPKRKIQFVKKIAPNLLPVSETSVPIKREIVNEHIVSNTPIVINKVNGNISGKFFNEISQKYYVYLYLNEFSGWF